MKLRIGNWRLRTKVAVVLVLPATVALVLGGVRVQGKLDDANRLSAVRDQLAVVAEVVALADAVSDEGAAVVDPTERSTDSVARQAVVDERGNTIRRAAGYARLPTQQQDALGDALAALSAARRQANGIDRGPIAATESYRAVVSDLSGLVPAIVAPARADDLDDLAESVSSLVLLRDLLATEASLIAADADGTPTGTAAAQDAAAEEGVLGRQLRDSLPDAMVGGVDAATSSSTSRREALRSAVTAGQAAPTTLLPGLRAEIDSLDSLRRTVLTDLAETVDTRTNVARSDALRDSALVIGVLLAALAIALLVGRSLLVPLRTLRRAALVTAHQRLPETVQRVRAGDRVDWTSVRPVAVHTDEEVGQLARAFDDVHRQAVRLAGEQAELRRQVSEMFMTLSRRSQSLVELQLDVIEELEAEEQDPARLAALFRLDHLATRLRRNGENLQVLAGGTPPRRGSRPVTVVELLRASISEVTDYQRIALGHAPHGSVRPVAAADIVHILAELLENATRFSPPDTKVLLTADRAARGGLLVEVVDVGLGITADDLAAANERLATTDAVDPETARRMGLYVVSQLAARHDVTVRLRRTHDTASNSGVTASVHVPSALILTGQDTDPPRGVAVASTTAGTAVVVAPSMVFPPLPSALTAVDWFTPAPRIADQMPPQTRDIGMRTTAAGLPMRLPARRPTTRPDTVHTAPSGAVHRDAETVRNNLSRHYKGVRAARQATEQ